MVILGYISKAHGIKGEVVIFMANEDSDFPYENIYIAPKSSTEGSWRKVLACRRHHKHFLLSLEGVTDRNAAELLRGYSIAVTREQLPPLSEDEMYIRDLLGLCVYVQEEQGDEVFLGTLINIAAPMGQELWEIETAEKKSVLLPAVPEFVLDIDLDEEKILIAPPPGLLDLYL